MKGVFEGGGGSSCRFRGAESPRFYVSDRERGAGSQQQMNFGMGLCVYVCVCVVGRGGGGGGGRCHLLKIVERTAKIIPDHQEGFATNPHDFCWQFFFLSHIFFVKDVFGADRKLLVCPHEFCGFFKRCIEIKII